MKNCLINLLGFVLPMYCSGYYDKRDREPYTMKIVFNNKYYTFFTFTNIKESRRFIEQHVEAKILYLDDTCGDYYYCCLIRDTLTGKVETVIGFESFVNENDLNLILLENSDVFILDTSSYAFLINENAEVIRRIDLMTPIYSAFVFDKKLIILFGDCYLIITNSKGDEIYQWASGWIEDMEINDSKLFVKTDEESFTLDLQTMEVVNDNT